MDGMKALKAQSAYSRPERPTNFITYVLAAGLSFVGLVFLLLKAVPMGVNAIVSSCVFGAMLLLVFVFGALAHILPASGARSVFCRIEKSAVGLLVFGIFAPVALYGMTRGTHTDAIWGYALYISAALSAVTACVFTVAGVKNYKLVCLFMYVVLGLACTVRAALVAELLGLAVFWLLLGGGAAYILGCIFGAWETIPYRHTVMHVFIMCGAALHYVCLYCFIF